MHVVQMTDNREEGNACDGRRRHGSVIRSLGGDTRTALVAGRTHGRARMVATSRRKRMVAPSIADVPFLFAVMVRRRTFFQEDPSIMFLTLGLYIMPPDKVEVEPCFMVAALISRAQAQGFMRNGERTVKPNFPVPIRFRKFKEPTGDHWPARCPALRQNRRRGQQPRFRFSRMRPCPCRRQRLQVRPWDATVCDGRWKRPVEPSAQWWQTHSLPRCLDPERLRSRSLGGH